MGDLPASGYRNGSGLNNVGSNGNYWSRTANGTQNARNLEFWSGNVNPQNNNNRYNGFAVRLVRASRAAQVACVPQSFYRASLLEKGRNVSGPFGRPPRRQRSFPDCMGAKLWKTALREERVSASSRAWLEENLTKLLFKAYKEARKSDCNSYAQVEFESDVWTNIGKLKRELLNGTYRPSRCIIFTVCDPVKREVIAPAFRDQVVDHLLYDYLYPVFDPGFIDDSYSCRKGKGTSYGIDRLEHHIRSVSENYTKPCVVLQLDLTGYFMSINHRILYGMVMDRLLRKNCRSDALYPLVAYLIRVIIFTDPTVGCIIKGTPADWEGLPASKSYFNCKPGTGLPIGKLTSQLFSNIYLDPLDQYMKRVLKLRHEGRYVDDFYAVVRTYAKARAVVHPIRMFLRNRLRLRLHPRKIRVQEAVRGAAFLGVVIRRGGRTLSRRSSVLMARKTCDALMSEENPFVLDSRLASCRGHVRRCRERRMESLLSTRP